MKRTVPLLLLGLALTACGAASPGATGGRPPLPTGVEVRHPAAPSATYLNLVTEAGESVYQKAVSTGATRTEVDPAAWQGRANLAQAVEGWIPAGATDVKVSAPGTGAVFLRWLMWQDKDSDGQRDEGETLDLMTHDRVVYAGKAVTVDFRTATPDMVQHWQFAQGWGRAEHYVYLPLNSTTYRRSLETQGLGRYELHVPTPITSQ